MLVICVFVFSPLISPNVRSKQLNEVRSDNNVVTDIFLNMIHSLSSSTYVLR